MEVAVAGGGTDVLESDAEQAAIPEEGALDVPLDEEGISDGHEEVDDATAPAEQNDTMPVAGDGKKPARDSQAWTSKLTMLLVAIIALAGLAVLAVALTRDVTAEDASDDFGDLSYNYTCDRVSGSDPGVFGAGNCHASGGMQASGVIPVGEAYLLIPRKANAMGYTQSFSCSGGRADSPSMVVPRRCAALGNPVPASR